MVTSKDLFNLMGALSQPAVDAANREFYGKITYPWPQMTYPTYVDPHCGTVFLNQEIGDWTHRRIPLRPRIWIAGCGSNQATLTALKFPGAEILATDISVPSLTVCEKNLAQVGVKNVTLKEQSINEADYADEFDYIICTGVIHHNADPSIPLARLAKALRRDGVLELAVYNYYHRILTTAYQKAMRYLFMNDPGIGLDDQLDVTRDLMERFPIENTMGFYLKQEKDQSREYLADSFLQPVEHSYTVESLAALLNTAGLELNLPCIYVFDKPGRMSWNLEFANEVAASHYEQLDDLARWQISNLLMVERSPSLVFYVQRLDSNSRRKSEKEVCEEFLDTSFTRYSTTIHNYIGNNGHYEFSATPIPHPSPRVPVDQTARRIFKEASPDRTIREILEGLSIEPTFSLVNNVRIQLTTPHFPYLKAAQRA
ncbi:MAG TPA: methyltransferase domain-containing protein [Pyrinomonadaceae bacterium]|nr:methyltransferase domain-containing protein [Pyrinomonadaceae bacterium]